jgi:hydroxymethylbilane synthase
LEPAVPTLAVPSVLTIATRESRLALWQAHHVRDRLAAALPHTEIKILGMTTQGDQVLDKTLSKIGGKGLFTKELEVAMLEGRADLAVHSCKDVPVAMDSAFTLAAILRREDPRDALVSARYGALEELPPGAIVGTSSLRREAQLRAQFPQLTVRPLRGNLDTRLGKLDRGEYDAIVLAAAGLKRLGLSERIRAVLPPEASLPAVGQGALAIEALAARPEVHAALASLHDVGTAACVMAERAVSRALGGSCSVPLAAYAVLEDAGHTLHLRARVGTPDGTRMAAHAARGPASAPEDLGNAVADALRAQGADAILAALA